MALCCRSCTLNLQHWCGAGELRQEEAATETGELFSVLRQGGTLMGASLAEAPNGEHPCPGVCSCCYPTLLVQLLREVKQPIVLFLQKMTMTVLPVEAQLQCAGYACKLTVCGPELFEVSTYCVRTTWLGVQVCMWDGARLTRTVMTQRPMLTWRRMSTVTTS